MKVKELIKGLVGFNPEAEIKFKRQSEDSYITGVYFSFKCKDDKGNKYTIKDTYQVNIELDDICDSCIFLDEDLECSAYEKPADKVGYCYQYQKR